MLRTTRGTIEVSLAAGADHNDQGVLCAVVCCQRYPCLPRQGFRAPLPRCSLGYRFQFYLACLASQGFRGHASMAL